MRVQKVATYELPSIFYQLHMQPVGHSKSFSMPLQSMLQWYDVKKTETNHTVQLKEDIRPFEFALSVQKHQNGHVVSSGMTWATCTYVKGEGKLKYHPFN